MRLAWRSISATSTTSNKMLIGLDFDNTIVCYDRAVKILAKKLKDIPPSIAITKPSLRDFLRSAGREDEWTELQSELYGPGMLYAEPYEGVVGSIKELKRHGHDLVIISHRTRYPYSGRRHNLHYHAKKWISKNLATHDLFSDADRSKKRFDTAHFLESKDLKLMMIKKLGCNIFVDDLLEILTHVDFPNETAPIHFAPNHKSCECNGIKTVHNWQELTLSILDRYEYDT